jgi:LamB porin
MGVFTIAPTIKPKGGFFSRPELRIFATYAIWSDGLKGSTAAIQEGGNTCGFSVQHRTLTPTKAGCLVPKPSGTSNFGKTVRDFCFLHEILSSRIGNVN